MAKILLNEKHLYAGFYCHLTVEKVLTVIVANTMFVITPKIHDLTKLAKRGGIFEVIVDE